MTDKWFNYNILGRRNDIRYMNRSIRSMEKLKRRRDIVILGPRDTYIKMKCSQYGYEKNAPDWVYDEFIREDIVIENDDKEIALECP